jgi:hypothetical protein
MLKTLTPKKKQEKKRGSLQVEAPCSFATTQTKQKEVRSAKDNTSIRHDKNPSHAGPATQ